MEDWSFPPAYDEAYRPPLDSRYWFPVRETMHPSDREKAILTRLQEVCAYAFDNSPFYRRKWEAAGFHPSLLKSLEDFESRVPVISKAELRAAQAAAPPFGDYLCVPENEVFHIHGTSGTTGRPTAFAIGRNDWRAIANAHARIMWGMGVRPGDTVCVAAIFSLYVGSWGALAGAERLGSKAFPFGAGATGMTRALRAMAGNSEAFRVLRYADLRTASCPDRLGRMASTPRGFGLRTMFFSGEPGASIPAVRAKDRGNLRRQGYRLRLDGRDDAVDECRGIGGNRRHVVLAGRRLHRGLRPQPASVASRTARRGTPVYTHLERTSQPMIRLLSGDLTSVGERAEPLRTHLSAAASGYHSAGSTTCSRSVARMSIRARSTQSSTRLKVTAASIESSSPATARWTNSR